MGMSHSLMDIKKKVILASGSPRRRELLTEAGITFVIDVSDVDETVEGLPAEMVAVLAERKARAVAEKYDEGLVIGSDTLVALDDCALGKPEDDDDARRMLKNLSGRTHDVLTGVCLIDAKTGKTLVSTVRSGVVFREVTDEEIEEYIATGEPRDKAGAYAIQQRGSLFVERIEGDFYNVVGLPLERVDALMQSTFGVGLARLADA